MSKTALYRRRTKIVATIGPATASAGIIARLIRAGMNVARLNLSHGSHEMHTRYIETIRRVSGRLNIRVAILMDLPGPKYRTGKLQGGQAILKKGARITLTIQDIAGDASMVSVNLPTLPQDINIGDTILLDDGALQLRALEKKDGEVKCRVIIGGVLTEGRGLVVPGMRNSAPFITGSLRQHILFAIGQQPDYLALSFVSNADDVSSIRAILRENRAEIPIIAKIERGEAVRKFDRILNASDGIMVARGDLGVDIPLEKVPLVQKEIIRKCNQAGKPVITATQMLESMVQSARPTRAEVTDVANAILDGTDATMLSAETSIGKYPLVAVKTMAKIAEATEPRLPYEQLMNERGDKWIEQETDELISYSACYTAYRLGATAIVAFTHSGSTARRVSKYRPPVPILAITSSDGVCGRLLMHWGVSPARIPSVTSVDELFSTGAGLARELGLAKPGDLIVITGGVPIGVAGGTNLLKVAKIE
ncbi:MAG: pyruvate kinase [Dehalococcoidales bacterium]|nr:pyruvate kinase [Dehalococcoidales bacterium]